MRYFLRIFIIPCCLFVALQPAYSLSPGFQSKVKVVTEVLPPYQFLDKNNQASGYSIDVINQLFSNAQIDFELEFYPWPRAYRAAINNKNTVIFSLARTPQRESAFLWIGKLHGEEYAFYRLKSMPNIETSSLNQIMNYSVAVMRDSPNDQFLTDRKFVAIERTPDVGQTVKMLFEKRVDFLFGSDAALKSKIRQQGYNEELLKKVFRVPELDADLYIAIGLGSHPQLVYELQKSYQLMQQNGSLEQLQKKWRLKP